MHRFLLFIFGLTALVACDQNKDKTRATIGEMTESVYASVTIEPEDVYDVYVSLPGIVEEILVEEGDSVSKGQVIASIKDDDQEINATKAALDTRYARAKYKGKANLLESIEDQIATAEIQLKLDSTNYFRQKRLWDKKIGSKSELENRSLKYQLSQNKLSMLRNDYRQAKLDLENSYRQSEKNLMKAQTNLADYTIRSRMKGMVYDLFKDPGEQVSQMEPLARIGAINSFIIEMRIDEVDVAHIEIGQKALITLDAYEDEVFEARVNRIYPQKDLRNQTFRVEGTFDHPPEVLYAGLSGEANIILSQRSNVLTIPLEYLVAGNKVITSDGEVEVKVGRSNIDRVEILSGIDSGNVIYKP